MKFITILLSALLLNCYQSVQPSQLHFRASTPGDSLVKKSFGIESKEKIDFIRWDLKLATDNTFDLQIKYGVGKPNTLDFADGGTAKSFKNNYRTTTYNSSTVYQLQGLPETLSLLRVNSNLLHVLDRTNKLLTGNGGWSYILNKENPVQDIQPLKSLPGSFTAPQQQVVYEGRTPCEELASKYNIEVPGDCIKLKWLLTLQRDAGTMEPTSYILKRTHHRQSDINGKWSVKKSGTDAAHIVIELSANKNEKPISLLVVDDNVLLFLDPEGKLFTGNADFSYALNRRN